MSLDDLEVNPGYKVAVVTVNRRVCQHAAGTSHQRKIISDPAYDLFQPRYSPDGRWIVFEAIKDSTK